MTLGPPGPRTRRLLHSQVRGSVLRLDGSAMILKQSQAALLCANPRRRRTAHD